MNSTLWSHIVQVGTAYWIRISSNVSKIPECNNFCFSHWIWNSNIACLTSIDTCIIISKALIQWKNALSDSLLGRLNRKFSLRSVPACCLAGCLHFILVVKAFMWKIICRQSIHDGQSCWILSKTQQVYLTAADVTVACLVLGLVKLILLLLNHRWLRLDHLNISPGSSNLIPWALFFCASWWWVRHTWL